MVQETTITELQQLDYIRIFTINSSLQKIYNLSDTHIKKERYCKNVDRYNLTYILSGVPIGSSVIDLDKSSPTIIFWENFSPLKSWEYNKPIAKGIETVMHLNTLEYLINNIVNINDTLISHPNPAKLEQIQLEAMDIYVKSGPINFTEYFLRAKHFARDKGITTFKNQL